MDSMEKLKEKFDDELSEFISQFERDNAVIVHIWIDDVVLTKGRGGI